MDTAAGLRRGASGSGAKALCVLVHGRGQSPEDMDSHILARLRLRDVAIFLPRAPRGAWYDAKAVDPITEETRGQLGDALAQLGAEIAELRRDAPLAPLLLAGFSQGACLSIEYACVGSNPPEALFALTGCRVGTEQCARPDAVPAGLPIYLSGSDADPWIPLEAMMAAARHLGQRGARLRADVFPGRAHHVSDAEIAMLQSALDDLAHGRLPTMAAQR
jgi:phospholipase/carboxylesterase